MIFVTVGTTMPFDELLVEVDRLAACGFFGAEVVCQAGQSAYRMDHAEQFVGRPSIDDLIAESSLVITHGGATVIQLLATGKPFVAFPNPRGAGDHQTSFLAAMARSCTISWSRNVHDLERLVLERQALGPARIPDDYPQAAGLVRQLLVRDPV
jgi:UDP-N-acetylglucosamine transferase subunit ALG13